MRKIFFWFGVVAFAVVVLLAGGLGYLAYLSRGLDQEARLYAEATVVAVTSRWDRDELLRRSTTQLENSVSHEQLATLFDRFSALGKLMGSPICAGTTTMSAATGQGRWATGRYMCDASYTEGKATVRLEILKRDNAWRTNSFRVESPVLSSPRPAQKI